MSDSGTGWWVTAEGQWNQGTPPAGWWQASDGHWYPPPAVETSAAGGEQPRQPDDASEDDAPTSVMPATAPTDEHRPPDPGRPTATVPPTPRDAPPAGLAERYRSAPLWARIAAPAVVVLLVLGIAAAATSDTDEVAATDATTTTALETTTTTERSTTTTSTTTSTTSTTTTTTAPPTTTTTTTAPPTTTTAPPPTQPPTTAPPPTTAAPAAATVTPGAFCSPAGSTGVTTTGLSMTCATQQCDGTPYTQPRWRRTHC